jgi:hypothetical protein
VNIDPKRFEYLGTMRPCHGHVVFKAISADVGQQLAEACHLADRDAAIHAKGVVRELPLAHVGLDLSRRIVRGNPEERHLPRCDVPLDRAEATLSAERLSQEIERGDLNVLTHEALWEIAAMGTDAFVGLMAVVVVPVQEAWDLARGQQQGHHGHCSSHVDLAGARQAVLAHETHGQTRGTPVVLLHARPTLHGTGVTLIFCHPLVDGHGELGLSQDVLWRDIGRDGAIGMDFGELLLDARSPGYSAVRAHLDAAWTKNRLKGFQPLPERLVKRLAAYADTGVVAQLYGRFFPRSPDAERALLYVPSHPARELDEDFEVAGIPKMTKDGKMDFAALRDSYVTLVAEAGANVKELQTLARHSTPVLTLNVYAKSRDERLAELAERIGESVLFEQECATSVHRQPTEVTVLNAKLLPSNNLETHTENGGGGIRTPVPRCFRTSILRA